MAYLNVREEELKNKIAQDYFGVFDCTQIIGNVDFCVRPHNPIKSQVPVFEVESLLWAEAKKGKSDIYKSIVQLILTIGKARTFDKILPPAYIGAFDAHNIAFVAYNDIHDIFYQNDFNWNVTPSDYETKEFALVLGRVTQTIDSYSLIFDFDKDKTELNDFIKTNFIVGKSGTSKIRIDKNNFMVIYNKWLQAVKPTIGLKWDLLKKVESLIDGDFYLADLLSDENESLKEKLFVYLKRDHYELERVLDEYGLFKSKRAFFTDKQAAHKQFWNRYDRPPREEYWDYIVDRRDLLVPQDVRERKGSFFTPQIWVEKSQEYLTDALGDDWQDNYYIWDCAAGTGNLLAGLTNKYHIWASTLDKQDVDVMHDRIETMNQSSIKGQGSSLLDDHVFQFDFLNDDFNKLPQSLQDVVNDPEKRKKLVIYINPPYAEAPQRVFEKEGKIAVEQSKTNEKYASLLGQGNRELFAQFLTRIYFEIPDCIIAEFSKLKIISGPHFIDFRKFFKAELKSAFICPASSFDNVKGQFPIGFMIWDTTNKVEIAEVKADAYDKNGLFLNIKFFNAPNNSQYINDWVKPYRADPAKNQLIGKFPFMGNDFQQQSIIQINHHKMIYNKAAGQFLINQKNVMYACVYFAVRKCIEATWLNDRDQFLFPNQGWQSDTVFQNDCLAYTLFSNNVQSQYGTNHWIPFTEHEVKARQKFESSFMANYIAGKVNREISYDLFEKIELKDRKPLVFSAESTILFEAGLKLWQYYHKTIANLPLEGQWVLNASLYDIREYFQGRNDTGKMNNQSDDELYTALITDLRNALKIVAQKIEPKVYEYGFLKS